MLSMVILAALIAANTYSGVLTVVTAADSLRSVTPTRRLRLPAYVAGVVAELPFMVLPFFVGPAAVALGRVDISFLVGLGVSATVYLVLARRAGVAR